MASWADIPDFDATAHGDGDARQRAVWAMRVVARELAVEPATLRASSYRGFRRTHEEAALPSMLTISLLFRGWQRACEYVAVCSRDELTVEVEVSRTLYGDPSGRRHIRGTQTRHVRESAEACDITTAITPRSKVRRA
jgi:hypothetical protein